MLKLKDKRWLLRRFREYYHSLPDVHHITEVASPDQSVYEPLRRVYRNKRQIVSELVDLLIQDAGGSCPYCGQILALRTLDHFLPQDKYPDFAVLRGNLVPICDSCNGSKGSRVTDGQGNRLVMHPYADVELADGLMEATVRWMHRVPRFDIGPARSLKPELRSRVFRHLDACGVGIHFSRTASMEFRRWKTVQRLAGGYTRPVLTNRMIEEGATHEVEYGMNNWRSVAIRAMLADAKTFDAILNAHL